VGATWGTRTFGFTAGRIYMLLPANTADPQDVCALAVNTASSVAPFCMVIDDSANSFGSTTIGSIPMVASVTYLQFSASIRHSDNHVIFAWWSELDSATADLQVWDLDPSSPASNGTTAVQKTDVLSNTSEYAQCGVHIDQTTSYVRICYLGGGTWATSANAYSKLSTDGGTTWGPQTQLNATTKDYRAIWCDLGGTATRFIPAYQDDDLDDIFVNKDNSVVIAPPAAALDGAATLALAATGDLTSLGAIILTGAATLSLDVSATAVASHWEELMTVLYKIGQAVGVFATVNDASDDVVLIWVAFSGARDVDLYVYVGGGSGAVEQTIPIPAGSTDSIYTALTVPIPLGQFAMALSVA
jgi:hypothetical protein